MLWWYWLEPHYLLGLCAMLTYSTNYFQRLTLESWLTNLEQTPLNRCWPPLAPYKQLIHDINITNELNRTTDLCHLNLAVMNTIWVVVKIKPEITVRVTSIFVSSTALCIYDFHVFTVIYLPLGGFIWN